ncbi:MAG: helix-turn-helix domain-containing protein, partial [Halobacteriales archaeon]|nr:helix-turn-helix domain-containing protein [Halobacteriales archaeon]
MARRNPADSPLEAAVGAASPDTVEAFKLLGDETRLAILLALWEAYDPQADDNTVPFSELYDRVDIRDSGTFTYHLDKLVGNYVESVEDGYRLRNSGLKLVRAVIAGAGLEERRLEPTAIPRRCTQCDAPVELSYADERLYHSCTECDGHIGPDSSERSPRGTLLAYDNFNPAGLTDRTPEEVFVASTIEYHRSVTLLIRGVCPQCSGPVEKTVIVCEDHEAPSGELCPACGTWNEVRASFVCGVCKYSGSYPAWVAVHDHPAVVGFYHDHGFEMTYGLDDPEECAELWKRLVREQELVSRDPLRVEVTVTGGDDA